MVGNGLGIAIMRRCGMVGGNRTLKWELLVDATFRRLIAACFLNQLGFQAAFFVGIISSCTTYVLDAGAAEVSALVFVMNVVMLVGYSAAGALIDAVGPRIVLVASLALPLAAVAVVFAMPVCMASLLVVAIVMGLAGAAASTAVETFPRYLTNDEVLLARVNSLNSVVTFVAVIAGPLLAGAIADVTDSRLVFAVLPVTSVLGVLVALCLRERVRPEHPQDSGRTTPSLLACVADGVRTTVANPALIVLFAVCFLGNLGFGAFDSLESLFYRDVLRVGAEWMGWLTAIVGVGATVGSLLAGRVPTRRVTLPALCGLLVVEGLGAVLYTATPFVWCAAAGQLVLGAANGMVMPLRVTLTQRNCELGHLGSVSALMRVGISVSGTLPLLAAPMLADAFGVQAVLVSAAALVALTGAALVAAARRVHAS